uniref:NR LBD domain-containing protein n=1 Tax=Heterorhabditis bacteriophora TaxID=37862 RepID=A0A1I7XHU2_HETBA
MPPMVTSLRQRNKSTPYMPSYMEEGQSCAVCGDAATGLHYRERRHLETTLAIIKGTLVDDSLAKELKAEVGVWELLPLSSQMQMLHSTILEVQLLRFISFFDDAEDCFRPTRGISIKRNDLIETLGVDVVDSEEKDEIRMLLSSLFSLARSFAALQLDHRQLAVLSALFIFNPDNLDPNTLHDGSMRRSLYENEKVI